MTNPIYKLLIANRGEIAVRIIRTARRLGIETVAVFSDADAKSLHVKLADTAVALHGNTPLESYASIEKIVAACKKSGADAVHPGYGFLSENAAFAEACQASGITFVGPDVKAIDSMGHKSRAKDLMVAAGVPTLPGYSGKEQDLDYLIEKGKEIGFPVMIKAAAGGGGRGMRIATDSASLRDLLLSARAESERAFGSGELLLERALFGARHVEVQVFGDRFGNVVHLGERDCSVQRRHQKVLEESPCPQVTESLRADMGACAVKAAKAIGYVGAGTIEFLLDRDHKYYFLEMNTRLQVEHPVTECVTGLDLVEWQLLVAQGEKLPLKQDEIRLQGHAIEARLYAEDPDNNFHPQIGKILSFKAADEEVARTDHGLNESDEVSPYYDAMLAKIICRGDDRQSALRKLKRALQGTTVFGIKTNLEFLVECLGQKNFAEGDFDTKFIDGFWHPTAERKLNFDMVALSAAILIWRDANWGISEIHGWSSNADMNSILKLEVRERGVVKLHVKFHSNLELEITDGKDTRTVAQMVPGHFTGSTSSVNFGRMQYSPTASQCEFILDGIKFGASYVFEGDVLHVLSQGEIYVVEDILLKPAAVHDTIADGEVVSPTNGLLGSIDVQIGDVVEKGAPLFTVDAMKLLQTIYAPVSGKVIAILAEAGQQLKAKQLVIQIECERGDDSKSVAEKEKTLAIH